MSPPYHVTAWQKETGRIEGAVLSTSRINDWLALAFRGHWLKAAYGVPGSNEELAKRRVDQPSFSSAISFLFQFTILFMSGIPAPSPKHTIHTSTIHRKK